MFSLNHDYRYSDRPAMVHLWRRESCPEPSPPTPTSYARVDEEETGRCPAIGKQLRNNRKMSGKIINTLSSSPPTDSDLGILLDLET